MVAKKIEALVLDVGGVLLDWDPEYLYEELIPDDIQRDSFLFNVCSMEWHSQTDAGRSFSDIIDEKKAEFPGEFDQLIEAWWLDWDEMCGGIFEGTFDLVQMARSKNPNLSVFGITNFSDETWPRLLSLYPIFKDFFDDVIVSGTEKMVKPDPAIYELAIKRFDLNPRKSIFVDDKSVNVKAAQDLGFVGHIFESPKDFSTFLTEFDVIS